MAYSEFTMWRMVHRPQHCMFLLRLFFAAHREGYLVGTHPRLLQIYRWPFFELELQPETSKLAPIGVSGGAERVRGYWMAIFQMLIVAQDDPGRLNKGRQENTRCAVQDGAHLVCSRQSSYANSASGSRYQLGYGTLHATFNRQ